MSIPCPTRCLHVSSCRQPLHVVHVNAPHAQRRANARECVIEHDADGLEESASALEPLVCRLYESRPFGDVEQPKQRKRDHDRPCLRPPPRHVEDVDRQYCQPHAMDLVHDDSPMVVVAYRTIVANALLTVFCEPMVDQLDGIGHRQHADQSDADVGHDERRRRPLHHEQHTHGNRRSDRTSSHVLGDLPVAEQLPLTPPQERSKR